MKDKLWGDLKTDDEKSEFIRCGRALETGIIAKALEAYSGRFRKTCRCKRKIEATDGMGEIKGKGIANKNVKEREYAGKHERKNMRIAYINK